MIQIHTFRRKLGEPRSSLRKSNDDHAGRGCKMMRRPRILEPVMTGICLTVVMCAAVSRAAVQLDQNCVVSVLNRTVQVNADGTWVLPNIPANFGPVRARATYVSNGVTQFGQSDFFTLAANGSTDVPPIVLG